MAPHLHAMQSYCPYCYRAKAALLAAGIEPLKVELDHREDGAKVQAVLLAKTGKRTVPSVWLHGKYFGGSDDTVAGLKAGKFDGVDRVAAVEVPAQAGYKPCGADDSIPCRCTAV